MSSIIHIDHLGRKIKIPFPPKRIVSIVPSQTELLHHLGLQQEVVGITKFCIHPEEWFKAKQRVGGTKQLHLDKIRSLHPDFILANKEENDADQILALCEKFPVWISDIRTIEESLSMIQSVGEITNKISESQKLIAEIKVAIANHLPAKEQSVAYFIWNEPLMTVNSDTFIHDMMRRAGLRNVFANRNDSRYPVITEKELIDANPEIILLSSEPYPFKEEHQIYLEGILPGTKVLLADGEMFSWYGSRMLKSFKYFTSLLSPHF